jgi:hypothetical protein
VGEAERANRSAVAHQECEGEAPLGCCLEEMRDATYSVSIRGVSIATPLALLRADRSVRAQCEAVPLVLLLLRSEGAQCPLAVVRCALQRTSASPRAPLSSPLSLLSLLFSPLLSSFLRFLFSLADHQRPPFSSPSLSHAWRLVSLCRSALCRVALCRSSGRCCYLLLMSSEPVHFFAACPLVVARPSLQLGDVDNGLSGSQHHAPISVQPPCTAAFTSRRDGSHRMPLMSLVASSSSLLFPNSALYCTALLTLSLPHSRTPLPATKMSSRGEDAAPRCSIDELASNFNVCSVLFLLFETIMYAVCRSSIAAQSRACECERAEPKTASTQRACTPLAGARRDRRCRRRLQLE